MVGADEVNVLPPNKTEEKRRKEQPELYEALKTYLYENVERS